MSTPLLNWCQKAASDREPNPSIQRQWRELVAAELMEGLLGSSPSELALLGQELEKPLLRARFKFLTGNPEFAGSPGERVFDAIRGMVGAALQTPWAAESFARAMRTDSIVEGEWAVAAWQQARENRHLESAALLNVQLVTYDGLEGSLLPFVVQRVEAPWIGPRIHPFRGASLVGDPEFFQTVDLAFRAVEESYPTLCHRYASLWWIEDPLHPVNGRSHGGAVAVAFASIAQDRGVNPRFFVSCELDPKEPCRLRPVQYVRQKAEACLAVPESQLYVHPENLKAANSGSSAIGNLAGRVITGDELGHLVESASATFGFPQALSRLEVARVFEVERGDCRAVEGWADLLVEVASPEGRSRLVSGGEAIAEERRLVLEGAPGSGKSWMLRRMVAQGRMRCLPNRDGHIEAPGDAWATAVIAAPPLYESLRGHSDSLSRIAELLPTDAVDVPVALAALREGRVAIAVDRCEDLDFEKAFALARVLDDLVRREPDLRFVLAVRSGTDAAEALEPLEWSHARLVALNGEKVDEVLACLTRTDRSLRAASLSSPAPRSCRRRSTILF